MVMYRSPVPGVSQSISNYRVFRKIKVRIFEVLLFFKRICSSYSAYSFSIFLPFIPAVHIWQNNCLWCVDNNNSFITIILPRSRRFRSNIFNICLISQKVTSSFIMPPPLRVVTKLCPLYNLKKPAQSIFMKFTRKLTNIKRRVERRHRNSGLSNF